MQLDIYQIDAFARRPFEGNPAAVCPLESWLTDELMQSIAAENNLSETAFFVRDGDNYHIRWFTPAAEVDLCGHATLATAFVLFNCLGASGDTITFDSKSGLLPVSRDGDRIVMDFPAQPAAPCDTPIEIVEAFGMEPVECLQSADLIAVFDHEDKVRSADPDIATLARLKSRGIIITAAADAYDFISRFFGPAVGIPEDPVTGSAHTQLVPYWSQQTGKSRFRARQVSARGGDLFCELAGDRVFIAGTAVLYLHGSITVDE